MKRLLFLIVTLLIVVGSVSFFEQDDTAIAINVIEKTKILIVVGHDNDVWGSRTNGVSEVEFNRELGGYLYDFLAADPYFSPTITQKDDDYIPELTQYFETNEKKIEDFRAERRTAYAKENAEELHLAPDTVKHNRVDEEVANRLYGTNMWAEEQGFDALVHVHFNDYPGRPRNKPGVYSGFAIYAPNEEFKNGPESLKLAYALYDELARFQAPSNLPVEKDGVIQSQYLIALGGRNSLAIPSVLVEYSYLAEARFHGPLRATFIKELAYETYLGLRELYTHASGMGLPEENDPDGSLLLPHIWNTDIAYGAEHNIDIAALQTFLRSEGFYPPTGRAFNDCVISGSFGPCTRDALKEFQEQKGIAVTGVVDGATRELLNAANM